MKTLKTHGTVDNDHNQAQQCLGKLQMCQESVASWRNIMWSMCIPHNQSARTDTGVMIFLPSLTIRLWLWGVVESSEQSQQLDIELRGSLRLVPWMLYSLVHANAHGFLLGVGTTMLQPEFEPSTNECKAGEVLIWCWPHFQLYFLLRPAYVKRTLHGVPVLWWVSSRDPGLPPHQKMHIRLIFQSVPLTKALG